jgi:hypothetical protein
VARSRLRVRLPEESNAILEDGCCVRNLVMAAWSVEERGRASSMVVSSRSPSSFHVQTMTPGRWTDIVFRLKYLDILTIYCNGNIGFGVEWW